MAQADPGLHIYDVQQIQVFVQNKRLAVTLGIIDCVISSCSYLLDQQRHAIQKVCSTVILIYRYSMAFRALTHIKPASRFSYLTFISWFESEISNQMTLVFYQLSGWTD